MTATATALALAYLATGVLFILGLKLLSSPARARTGNLLAAIGMLIAVVATLFDRSIISWTDMLIGAAVGAVIGYGSARAVKMTAMPQMVALFNGAGGGAAALVAAGEFLRLSSANAAAGAATLLPIILSTIIGAISFAGSLIAFAKLQELMTGRPITYAGQQAVNALIALAVVALAVAMLVGNTAPALFVGLVIAAAVLGVSVVLPIGGADMPVVISLLNSFTGVAVAITGFVLSNDVLIISGTLVGASGTLLTMLMAKAMNRSVSNVLFGAFGSVKAAGAVTGAAPGGTVRSGSVEDIATLLAYGRSVIIVPGYGMAVAQAQHAVRELSDNLEKRGVEVKFAIHPVAGRMPGHMNVLLAEANVPYSQLHEMDEINPQFAHADVALVIGANDVTNPAARNVPSSPIYGMPILNVDEAQNVVVLKRSMNPGFAGIDNPLYENPKTTMLFGDAKATVTSLAAEVARV
ncbi:MAG: NAD(P)(+) transhydrogenase (Re/Si-specific) subunit beta [Candidatus Eremiobacteraeota bacterium]|nr:NAD(P)(+) transhydrogenase (Re/Si-specific) subunit beta [Candidatus Eremiobacteraeota bacterium]MBC5826134.1 NAD(P)(+) transhydrogenase (Re/Si-specific) subunit beta [Candidatus Eremiobacteraeota bacterium]